MDSDGDTISIGNEDDFDECMEFCSEANLTTLKLLIAKSVDDAKFQFDAWSSENTDSLRPGFTPNSMLKQDNYGNFIGQNFSNSRFPEELPEK